MAYSIAKAVQKSVKGYNRGGSTTAANFSIKKVGGKAKPGGGNRGSFGNRKNSKLVKSINSGGNYGVIGY